jgi:hypothetical protein
LQLDEDRKAAWKAQLSDELVKKKVTEAKIHITKK